MRPRLGAPSVGAKLAWPGRAAVARRPVARRGVVVHRGRVVR